MNTNGESKVIDLFNQSTVYSDVDNVVPSSVTESITCTDNCAGYSTKSSKLYSTCVSFAGVISVETTLYPACEYSTTGQFVPGRVVTVINRLSVTIAGTSSSGP